MQANLGYQMLANRFMKPALIRDTSRLNFKNMLYYPFSVLFPKDIMKNVVLNSELQS